MGWRTKTTSFLHPEQPQEKEQEQEKPVLTLISDIAQLNFCDDSSQIGRWQHLHPIPLTKWRRGPRFRHSTLGSSTILEVP